MFAKGQNIRSNLTFPPTYFLNNVGEVNKLICMATCLKMKLVDPTSCLFWKTVFKSYCKIKIENYCFLVTFFYKYFFTGSIKI